MHLLARVSVAMTLLVLAPLTVSANGDDTALDRPLAFSGSIIRADAVSPETWEIVDGVAEYRGGTWRGEIQEMSDHRFDGAVTIRENRDLHLGAFGLALASTALRIETDEGAWTEVPSLAVDFGDERPTTRTSAFLGEGAYAGWIAVAQVTFDPVTGAHALEGVILEAEIPPAPEDADGQ